MAEVSFELEFRSAGFQRVLNSEGTRALLNSTADAVVARSHGLAHKRGFTATMFGYGPRPAVTVFTHARSATGAKLARQALEGAM